MWRCDGAMCVVARSLGRAAPLLVLLTIVACQACSSQLDTRQSPARLCASLQLGFRLTCASDRSRGGVMSPIDIYTLYYLNTEISPLSARARGAGSRRILRRFGLRGGVRAARCGCGWRRPTIEFPALKANTSPAAGSACACAKCRASNSLSPEVCVDHSTAHGSMLLVSLSLSWRAAGLTRVYPSPLLCGSLIMRPAAGVAASRMRRIRRRSSRSISVG